MLIKTKANLISYFDDSYVNRDGNPVAAYKVQIGRPGEAAIDLPLEESAYNKLVSAKAGYAEDVPVTLDLKKYGNKLFVRCADIL